MFSSSLQINNPRENKQFFDREKNKLSATRVTEEWGVGPDYNKRQNALFVYETGFILTPI
jgi:hypothetical protein